MCVLIHSVVVGKFFFVGMVVALLMHNIWQPSCQGVFITTVNRYLPKLCMLILLTLLLLPTITRMMTFIQGS